MLEQLEEGEVIEDKAELYREETLAHYRIAILILSAMTAVSIFVILLLLLSS